MITNLLNLRSKIPKEDFLIKYGERLSELEANNDLVLLSNSSCYGTDSLNKIHVPDYTLSIKDRLLYLNIYLPGLKSIKQLKNKKLSIIKEKGRNFNLIFLAEINTQESLKDSLKVKEIIRSNFIRIEEDFTFDTLPGQIFKTGDKIREEKLNDGVLEIRVPLVND